MVVGLAECYLSEESQDTKGNINNTWWAMGGGPEGSPGLPVAVRL